MFQKHLMEDCSLQYGEFLNDLSKRMVHRACAAPRSVVRPRPTDDPAQIKEFPGKVNFFVMGCVNFFKSSWDTIKGARHRQRRVRASRVAEWAGLHGGGPRPRSAGNAAIFVGFVLGNLPANMRKSVTCEHVCGALIALLKDPAASVRTKAAEAIALLYEY